MLIGYLLLGYVISAIGFLLYTLLLKKKGSPGQRKLYLYSILAISLALPYPLLKFASSDEQPSFLHELHEESDLTAENTIPVSELNACYKKALSEKEYCECEDMELNNIILFQEDQFMETCLHCKSFLSSLSIILIAFILFVLLIRVGYLIYIVYTSEKSIITIDGKNYTVLLNPRTPLAASFRLFRQYIIWDHSLDQLNEEEKRAVCFHEIAHLKNLDTWEQIGLSILRMFWFPNPVFYKIQSELRLISEYLADAFAVSKTGNPQHYAALLIRLKEQQKHTLYQCFGAEDLKSRIVNIIHPCYRNKGLFASLMLSSIIIMATTGLIAAPPIKTQIKTIKQYELLQNKKSVSGDAYFCKACILEELRANCDFD